MKTLTASNRAKLAARLSQTKNDAKRTPDEVMRIFHEVDPTDKKAFVMPLFRWYLDGSMRYVEDAYKAQEGLTAYGRFRNRKLPPLRSLTFSDFLDLADELSNEKSQSDLSREETDAFFENGSAELFYDDERVRIVIPKTQESSCYFGRGTRWCTAADNDNHFDHYNDQGPLHIIMWKGKPHKWQMYLETDTILDERDEEISSDYADDLKYLFNEILIPKSLVFYDENILKVINFTGMGKNSDFEFHYRDGALHRDNDLPAMICADGDQCWYRNGKRHRDNDQPAAIYANGDQFWYRNGQLHRDNDKPAAICVNGTQKSWFRNDERHRDSDLPALIHANGDQCWYRNGQLHRDNDQPAVIYANGDQYWYQNGVLHRDNDQPAIIYANGDQNWYRNGIRI